MRVKNGDDHKNRYRPDKGFFRSAKRQSACPRARSADDREIAIDADDREQDARALEAPILCERVDAAGEHGELVEIKTEIGLGEMTQVPLEKRDRVDDDDKGQEHGAAHLLHAFVEAKDEESARVVDKKTRPHSMMSTGK